MRIRQNSVSYLVNKKTGKRLIQLSLGAQHNVYCMIDKVSLFLSSIVRNQSSDSGTGVKKVVPHVLFGMIHDRGSM